MCYCLPESYAVNQQVVKEESRKGEKAAQMRPFFFGSCVLQVKRARADFSLRMYGEKGSSKPSDIPGERLSETWCLWASRQGEAERNLLNRPSPVSLPADSLALWGETWLFNFRIWKLVSKAEEGHLRQGFARREVVQPGETRSSVAATGRWMTWLGMQLQPWEGATGGSWLGRCSGSYRVGCFFSSDHQF